jgi:hypothetical protein
MLPEWRKDFGLPQRPHRTAQSDEAGGVEQAVDCPTRGFVGAFHGGKVGVGADIVGGQKQIGDARHSVGTQRPGVDQIHQQRLGVGQETGAVGALLNIGIQEP